MYQTCIRAIQRYAATCLLPGVLVILSNTWASSELKLLSVNKTVTMSSTLTYDGTVWDAYKAVDGNTNRSADACRCCAATQRENQPWLQVDLGKRYEISEVKILGRDNSPSNDFNGLKIFLRQQSANMDTAIQTVNSVVHDGDFILENSIISQFVTLVLPGSSKILLVCEISVMGKELPVSLNKTVTMSSTLTYGGTVWDAYKAVDGNTNTSAYACHCCAATQRENNPWLQVDLGKPYEIAEVKLLGRTDPSTDTFQGVQIFLKPLTSNMGSALHTITDAVKVFDYILEDIHTSQFVTLVIPKNGKILLVCEISVMEDVDECLDNTDNCDANAVCTNTAVSFNCICNSGYTGDGVTCTDINECDSNPCLNGASCSNGRNNFMCTCAPGWTGTTCNSDINECDSSPCKNGATCINGRNNFICTCAPGWTGTTCNTEINECDSSPCKNGASCIDGLNNFSCMCAPGWTGITCNTDINECDSSPCKNSATCINGRNKFRCTCAPGWTGATCNTDVDECSDNTDNCDANSVCTDTAAFFTCICNSGYTGDGVTCTDVNECNGNTDNCHKHAVCTNTPGFFTCTCNSGYTGSRVAYVDECIDNTDNCHANAICTNTRGSFTCACNRGYTGDGMTCTDIDECTDYTDNCHTNAACTNTPEYFTCACNRGYTGDGTTCTDVDECTANIDNCHANTACTNTPGSFTCACNSGYTGDGVTCIDVDECTDNTDNCHTSAACTNTAGSFTCTCNHGYTGDGMTCTEMNLVERLRTNITTSMSSQYENWSSDKAIDGSSVTDPVHCDCCSGTQNSANSWWQLDLGQKYPVRSIQLFGRNEEENYRQLLGFQLYLSNTSSPTEPPYYIDTSSSGIFFNVSVPDILVQYITVKRKGILTMCEIKVYEADCPKGRYGEECSKQCHCADNRSCERESGACTSPMCRPGWRGVACNEGTVTCKYIAECPDNTFGTSCSNFCFCSNGDPCTKDSGVCLGDCFPGYKGNHCNEKCSNKTFGVNCSNTCGVCFNDEPCERTSGICRNGCTTPYIGELCKETQEESLVKENVEDSSLVSGTLIGSIAGGVLFLILVVCIVAVIVVKKRKESVYTRPNVQLPPKEESIYDSIGETTSHELQDIKHPVYENESQ